MSTRLYLSRYRFACAVLRTSHENADQARMFRVVRIDCAERKRTYDEPVMPQNCRIFSSSADRLLVLDLIRRSKGKSERPKTCVRRQSFSAYAEGSYHGVGVGFCNKANGESDECASEH